MTHEVDETTGEIVKYDPSPPELQVYADPVENFRSMRSLVTEVAKACTGPAFRAKIQGKDYPTVQWWTTVGASLGMFPYEVWSKKIVDEQGNMAYESFVEVRRHGLAITSASAICSTSETTWGKRDEYAVKSMATTRATAKAYRLGLSFLAVLAGLEATPAEEMPREGFSDGKPGARNLASASTCPEHNMPWRKTSRGNNAHPIKVDGQLKGWCDEDDWKADHASPVVAEAAALDGQWQDKVDAPEGEVLPW